MPRAQALNNVNPAAVLRPSGTVVSIKCVEKIIKKDMFDPFTGEFKKMIKNTIKEGVLDVLTGVHPGTRALTLRLIGIDASSFFWRQTRRQSFARRTLSH